MTNLEDHEGSNLRIKNYKINFLKQKRDINSPSYSFRNNVSIMITTNRQSVLMSFFSYSI